MTTITSTPQLGVEAVPVDEDQAVVVTIPQARLERFVVDVVASIRQCAKQRVILGNAILGEAPLDRDSITRAATVVANHMSMQSMDQVSDLSTDEALAIAEQLTIAARDLDRCTDTRCDNLCRPGSNVCPRCEDGPAADEWWQR